MHTRDASGKRVSLLNDDVTSHSRQQSSYCAPSGTAPASYYPFTARSASASPNTPELFRSDSYDSQMSNEPISPMTPVYDYGPPYSVAPAIMDPRSGYSDYTDYEPVPVGSKRPSAFSSRRSVSYDDDAASPPGSDRPGKRYPCRFRDSHHCEKTFTTSGHASRHSKIHTAEKAVPCSFPGCHKKFTRADNMKQHLDTHYKDKSRTSSSRPSLSSGDRSSSSTKSSSRSSKGQSHSVSSGGAWDMSALGYPLPSRPAAGRTPSGLDTLAMAIACQENN